MKVRNGSPKERNGLLGGGMAIVRQWCVPLEERERGIRSVDPHSHDDGGAGTVDEVFGFRHEVFLQYNESKVIAAPFTAGRPN